MPETVAFTTPAVLLSIKISHRHYQVSNGDCLSNCAINIEGVSTTTTSQGVVTEIVVMDVGTGATSNGVGFSTTDNIKVASCFCNQMNGTTALVALMSSHRLQQTLVTPAAWLSHQE